MAGPSLMDSLFQRTLDDLIKGLRLHTGGESIFISKAVDEIRREIKSTDPATKATALQKLTYLHSLHAVDMSWAAFHSVELSSSSVFHFKRIAYLAASLSFDPSTTDVILLLTHQLRKDLTSSNPHEVSLALHTLSFISTPDLARDLTPEIFTLLNSNKSFIKKKAIATLLRIFEQYPDAVRVCFKRLVENLESSDVNIVSAVVSVFCELASKEPRSYLPLAPEFYRILADSRNNWVLIKVLKIFEKLAPLEPRLGKRLVEPICEHLRRTGAKSLAFECVRTIVSSLSEYESAMKLAVGKIREFLMEDDPNLKYLGLQALATVASKHLWAVLENKEVVIKSLSDADVNIKLEALRLVMTMVSEDNVAEICRVLVNYALKSDPFFCNEILGSILLTCSRNYYELIVDFDWYVSLLGEMSRIPHCQKGEEIESQLVDIGMRVKDARSELVRVGRELLIDPALLGNPFIFRILSAAAWISGEYVEYSKDPCELMEALLQPRTSLLPSTIKAVYIQSVYKILTFCMYSYLCPSEVTDAVLEREYVESSGLVASTSVAECEPDEVFNPRILNEKFEDLSVENGENVSISQGQTSSASLKNSNVTQESVLNLLNLVEKTLGPLASSHEVEIRERARNVLSLIELIQQEIPGYFLEEGDNDCAQLKASQLMKLVHDAFSEELGPVSQSAQARVPMPEGLELKENLSEVEAICGNNTILPASGAFSLVRPPSLNTDNNANVSEYLYNEESEISTESTSLLAEHRKRHELYYLPSQNEERPSNIYPPANDPNMQDNDNDKAGEDLVKLTERSLIAKKKSSQTKARPIVVKLDDGDEISVAAKKPESKDDLISGMVRNVLLGNEAMASSSQTKLENSSSRKKGKEKLITDKPSDSNNDSTNAGNSEFKKTSSRRRKNQTSIKDQKHRSPKKEEDQQDQKEKQKSSHRHGRHKSRCRADGVTILEAQSPVVPDFLL